MSLIEKTQKRVKSIQDKVAARQKGEKIQIEAPILRTIQNNMKIRLETRRLFLPRKQTLPTPPPPPPLRVNTQKTTPPPAPITKTPIPEKQETEQEVPCKIYI